MQGAGTTMKGRPLAFKRTLPHPTARLKTVCVASPPSKYRSRQPSQEQLALAGASDRARSVVPQVTSLDEAATVVLKRPNKLWNAYLQSLEKKPTITKACTSFVGFIIGDILAQQISGTSFNPVRCLRLGAYGLFLDGPIGHQWYRLLDATVYPKDPQGTKAVLTKTALDQLVWAPVMTCIFFAVLKTLEGHPELILQTIQDKLVRTVVANYILWPAAHLVNFRFVPSEQRILFNNCVSIVWTVFLSTVTHTSDADACWIVPTTVPEAIAYAKYLLWPLDPLSIGTLQLQIAWTGYLSILSHSLLVNTGELSSLIDQAQYLTSNLYEQAMPPSFQDQLQQALNSVPDLNTAAAVAAETVSKVQQVVPLPDLPQLPDVLEIRTPDAILHE
eukprot:jgi/Astpho2/8929/Aster-02611